MNITLTVPLIMISVLVSWFTLTKLSKNTEHLTKVLSLQARANLILPLLLTQEDASKSMLIDPSLMGDVSEKKIDAYDKLQALLAELAKNSPNPEVAATIDTLAKIDQDFLRPIDTKVLELLFTDADAARQLYFKEYEPRRIDYEKNLRLVVDAMSTFAHEGADQFKHENERSIFMVLVTLFCGLGVVILVNYFSSRLERTGANTQKLLGVLSEGLLFFDSKGLIASERSQALSHIISDHDKFDDISSLFSEYGGKSKQNIQTVLDLLWPSADEGDFFSDFGSTVSMLPSEVILDPDGENTGARILRFAYRPLYSRDRKLDKIVIVVTDETQRIANEREAVQQAERVRKIGRIAKDVEVYEDFLSEAIKIFKNVDTHITAGCQDVVTLKRDLHTLKGNVATFEFCLLAKRIHELETTFEEEGYSDIFRQGWETLKDQWKFETTDIDQTLGRKIGDEKVAVSKGKLSQLSHLIQSKQDETLISSLNSLTEHPIRDVFSKYQAYIEQLAKREGDKRLKFSFANDSSELRFADIQSIDGALTHLFRNCFDHGIETVEERLRAGKAANGNITVACFKTSGRLLHFIIKDDGRGINTEKLVAKALERGLWTAEKAAQASADERIQLIFAAGLSTKDQITEISGRGVGLDAVNKILEDLGGKISVYSQAGQGTQFEIDIPHLASSERLAG